MADKTEPEGPSEDAMKLEAVKLRRKQLDESMSISMKRVKEDIDWLVRRVEERRENHARKIMSRLDEIKLRACNFSYSQRDDLDYLMKIQLCSLYILESKNGRKIKAICDEVLFEWTTSTEEKS